MQQNVRITSPKSCPQLGISTLKRKQNLNFKKKNQKENLGSSMMDLSDIN